MPTFQDKSGSRVPDVSFVVREGGAFKKVTTADLFDNQNVVFFALPGAFTPTCSSTHLPRYNELFDEFKKHGIDRIVCLSVNDTFVMNAWAKDQEAVNIDFIPDGNGDFSRQLGFLIPKTEIGFGERSWRYSMLVRNGTIEKMFIEPDKAGDPFEVSDADTMLKYIAGDDVKLPESVSIFTKPGCPHCARAKEALAGRSMKFEEIVLGKDCTIASLRAVSGRTSVPQVFVGGKHIGGNDDLQAYLADH